jgi:hypothetical protein
MVMSADVPALPAAGGPPGLRLARSAPGKAHILHESAQKSTPQTRPGTPSRRNDAAIRGGKGKAGQRVVYREFGFRLIIADKLFPLRKVQQNAYERRNFWDAMRVSENSFISRFSASSSMGNFRLADVGRLTPAHRV